MASENETVAKVVSEMRERCIDEKHSPSLWPYLDRIEEAHNHEIMELKNKCEEYERQPELMAETAKATLELLKAQESKIAELSECLKETVNNASDNMWWKRGCNETKNVCTNCKASDKTFPCPVKRWRKALEGTDSGNRHE